MCNRISFDKVFMEVAMLFAQRTTCCRAQIGAVLVKDKRIISTGYTGSPPNTPHCLDEGCIIDPKTGGCVRTLHAEINCLMYSAKAGISTNKTTLYTTMMPCLSCAKAIVAAGITEVVYKDDYRLTEGIEFLKSVNLKVRKYNE